MDRHVARITQQLFAAGRLKKPPALSPKKVPRPPRSNPDFNEKRRNLSKKVPKNGREVGRKHP